MIRQAYRFELAPRTEQERFLASCCGAARFWFNAGLALVKERLERRTAGDDVDVPWSYKALCTAFRGDAIKDELAPWRDQVVVGSYQAGLEALGHALENFSKARASGRRVGFPRFRAKGRAHEAVIFQYPRLPDNRHVDLSRRLGPIRTKESLKKLTRLLERDEQARIMRATVQRGSGGWFISFTVERSAKQRSPHKARAVVGVDLGLTRLATLSTGHAVANSKALGAALRALRRLQRQLDRQRRANNQANFLPDGQAKPGARTWVRSRRMARTEERISRLHRRVANVRREQAHQLTTSLTRAFGVIGVETLQITNLMANSRVARHIADAGWATILNQLRYKTSWSDGSMLLAADRFYPSSKTCSACGAVRAKLSLGERVFACDSCSHRQDRDLNAALNLAVMAQRHAQAEAIESYVARAGRFTFNARGGQVSLVPLDEHGPMKREESSDSAQRCEALAFAA